MRNKKLTAGSRNRLQAFFLSPRVTAVFLLVFFPLSLSACTSHEVQRQVGSSEASPVTPAAVSDSEMEAGRQIHEQILSSFYVYTAPEVVAYVNRVARKLGERAERKNLDYQVTILHSEKIFSASAPGGYVYLTTGLINFLDNEAELAAVLGSEIARIQSHGARFSNGRKAWDVVVKGGATVGPALGQFGALAALGLILIDAGMQKGLTSSKKKNLRADRRALHYMLGAGYDPQGMLDLMQKLKTAQKETALNLSDYLKTHPLSDDRIRSLEGEFAKLPMDGKTLEVHPLEYQAMTRGIREIYKR